MQLSIRGDVDVYCLQDREAFNCLEAALSRAGGCACHMIVRVWIIIFYIFNCLEAALSCAGGRGLAITHHPIGCQPLHCEQMSEELTISLFDH